jgi:hypothetical protein
MNHLPFVHRGIPGQIGAIGGDKDIRDDIIAQRGIARAKTVHSFGDDILPVRSREARRRGPYRFHYADRRGSNLGRHMALRAGIGTRARHESQSRKQRENALHEIDYSLAFVIRSWGAA